MFGRATRTVAALVVLLLFVPMALVACRDKPQWNERPERPLQTGRQGVPSHRAGGGR